MREAGWYPEPDDPSGEYVRYFNGVNWTDFRSSSNQEPDRRGEEVPAAHESRGEKLSLRESGDPSRPPTMEQSEPSGPRKLVKWGLIAAAVAGLAFFGSRLTTYDDLERGDCIERPDLSGGDVSRFVSRQPCSDGNSYRLVSNSACIESRVGPELIQIEDGGRMYCLQRAS